MDLQLCATGQNPWGAVMTPLAMLTTPLWCSRSSVGNPRVSCGHREPQPCSNAQALCGRSRCCEAPGLRAEARLRDVPADLHVRVINRAGRMHWHLPSFLKIAFPPRILKRSLLLSMLFPPGDADVPVSQQLGTRQQLPAHWPALGEPQGGLTGAVSCPVGTHIRAQVLPGQRRAVPCPSQCWGGVGGRVGLGVEG